MLPFLFIAVYLVLVLVRPQEYPQLVDSGLPLLPVALVSALLAWLASTHKRFDEPQYLLLPLFLLATCLSIAFNGWMGGAIEQFALFAPSLVAFVVLANSTSSPRRMTVVMALFTACAAVLALHGVEQASAGTSWTGMPLVEDGRIQYVGIFGDPNDLGMLFVICVPMAMYLGSRGGLLGLRRLFWMVVAGLLLYGIYLTNSRGSMLALVAMAGAWLWLRRGPLIAATLAAGCLLVMRMVPSRLHELDVSEQSASGRVDAWYEGIQMFINNPLYGVGTGRFTEYHHLTAHNSLVLVLAENGFIGFVLWFAFVGYCFWMMVRILRHVPPDDRMVGEGGDPVPEGAADFDESRYAQWLSDRAIAATLLVSLVGFAASAFFLSRSYVILLYLLAAVVVAHSSGVRERFPSIPGFSLMRDLPRWVVLSALATVGFYIVLKILLAMS